MMQVSVEPFPT